MQVKTLTCIGRANAGLAAAASNDLVRLGELAIALSGTAPLVHTHQPSDIIGLTAAIGTGFWTLHADSNSVVWSNTSGTLSAAARIKSGGGLLVDANGLSVDTSVVSVPGHTHVVADITDFGTGLITTLATILQGSSTIGWTFTPDAGDVGTETPAVNIANGGALKDTGSGLAVDLGTSHTQAAFGDHTHALLHPALSVAASSSLQINVDPTTQVLSAEVMLGLGLILNSGVAPDFGLGHNQVSRGDHTHPNYAGALEVQSSNTIDLSYDGSTIGANVKLDPTPGTNAGVLGATSNGLYVQLGSGTNQAAAGNHTHSNATETTPGFMSAADKIKLDALNGSESVASSLAQESLLIVLDGAGSPIPTGLYEYAVMPYNGVITGWDLIGIPYLPTGTLVVDIYKGAWGALPLDVSASITSGNKPQYFTSGTGQPKAQANSLNWTFSAGDVLGFNVDTCTITKRATLGLRITKT